MTNWITKSGLRIEETILIGIILLNILDFLEILPGDLDFIKKIISWTALGYLLYQTSLTKIFFGHRNRQIDTYLILTYFILILKNFIEFSNAAVHEAPGNLVFLYKVMLQFAPSIEQFSFYAGGIMLFVLAMFAAAKLDIRSPSLMSVIHESGKRPKSAGKFAWRSTIILLVFVFFFIAVFNLMMEWLAIAVDAPLLMLGIFFYLFKAKDFGTETLLYKLGNMGDEFFEKVIELFHDKNKLGMGIAGMLVLHLLTDVGIFVIPYLIGIHDILYFSAFGAGHTALPTLMMADINGLAIWSSISIVALYTLNAFAILFLLFAPAFYWQRIFVGGHHKLPNWFIALFFSSIVAFLFAPVFKISRLIVPTLVGVDLQTKALAGLPTTMIFIVAILVGLLVWLLSQFEHKPMAFIASFASASFFFLYTYLYFVDVGSYYIQTLSFLFMNTKIFVGVLLLLFFITTASFYALGIISFIRMLLKHHFDL